MTIELTHDQAVDERRHRREKSRRALARIQRTRIDPAISHKTLRMAAALDRILGTIDANEPLDEDRVLPKNSYSAGFAAALRLVEEHITDEVR